LTLLAVCGVRSISRKAILVLLGFTGPMPGWEWVALALFRGCWRQACPLEGYGSGYGGH
jgi:hypothetical protein